MGWGKGGGGRGGGGGAGGVGYAVMRALFILIFTLNFKCLIHWRIRHQKRSEILLDCVNVHPRFSIAAKNIIFLFTFNNCSHSSRRVEQTSKRTIFN